MQDIKRIKHNFDIFDPTLSRAGTSNYFCKNRSESYRESTQSWTELLVDLQRRGLTLAPKLATGDGALGLWAALRQVYSETREKRCWVHKTANVLNKMPKSVIKGRVLAEVLSNVVFQAG